MKRVPFATTRSPPPPKPTWRDNIAFDDATPLATIRKTMDDRFEYEIYGFNTSKKTGVCRHRHHARQTVNRAFGRLFRLDDSPMSDRETFIWEAGTDFQKVQHLDAIVQQVAQENGCTVDYPSWIVGWRIHSSSGREVLMLWSRNRHLAWWEIGKAVKKATASLMVDMK